jgi:uncharacterized membrane protein YtjA (UPF0391 family)
MFEGEQALWPRRFISEYYGENNMLRWAFIFLIVGLVAGLLGFTGIAGASIGIAKFLFFLFLAIFVVMVVLGLTVFRELGGR